MLKAEIAESIDTRIVRDIVSISRESYPPGWLCGESEECYGQVLPRPHSIVILLRDDDKNVGFLFAVPHNEAVAELKNDDPLMKEDSGAYYIENGAILPAYRQEKGLAMMFAVLSTELKRRGILRLSMHARVTNKLSRNTSENMRVIERRRIGAWKYYAYEEPTDFIIAELS